MTTKEQADQIRRWQHGRYVEWDRCEETGRKIGVWFVWHPFYLLLRLHRPTPVDREWGGVLVCWDMRTLIDTFPKGGKKGR
jgi:hypothetical protein